MMLCIYSYISFFYPDLVFEKHVLKETELVQIEVDSICKGPLGKMQKEPCNFDPLFEA